MSQVTTFLSIFAPLSELQLSAVAKASFVQPTVLILIRHAVPHWQHGLHQGVNLAFGYAESVDLGAVEMSVDLESAYKQSAANPNDYCKSVACLKTWTTATGRLSGLAAADLWEVCNGNRGSLRSDDATLKGSWCTSGQDTNSSEYPTLLSFGDSPRNTFANSGCDQMDTIPDMTSTTSAFLKRVQLRKHVRGAKANRRPQDEADKAKHLAKKQVPKGDRTKDRTRVGQLDFCFGSEADSVEDTLRWLQSSAHHFWGEAVVLEICLTPKYAGRDVQEPIWISLQNMQPFYPQPSTVEVALEILSNSTGHCAKWQFYERPGLHR
ncbi:unnamed protein product [Effrenium voratum]|nr:unnamed protein product [Effrenium voratum]